VSAIIDLLVKIQLLDDRQHDAVMSRSKGGTGGHIVQQIAEMGYATESTVARSISVELGLPRIDLSMTPPEDQAVALLDARTCADRFVLPVALRENGELLWLAMADPTDEESISVVRRRSNKRVRPAVAGPSEILRAVRVVYSAPSAGMNLPEDVTREKLAAIEIADQQENPDSFEVMSVGEDISSSPLSRIAAQLGVEVPANIPSRSRRSSPHDLEIIEGEVETSGAIMDARPAAPQRRIPPQGASQDLPRPPSSASSRPPGSTGEHRAVKTPTGEHRAVKPAGAAAPTAAAAEPRVARRNDELDQLSPTPQRAITEAQLDIEDLTALEALRGSLEKGALVLRAIAELCVEKGVFTSEEMRRRSR
jgi:type IV pilus assembly protein PilB